MKKLTIFLIIVISLIPVAYFTYTNISLLPHELLVFLRSIRDDSQEMTKSLERTSGIPLQAKVYDKDFFVEEFVTGLHQPTQMTFVGKDILVLEKNEGLVRLVKNNVLQQEPILDVEVGRNNESGLLGITSKNSTIYIYYTEASKDGDKTFANNLYQYSWNGQFLTNPVLINSLPSKSSWHNGGGITVDNDGQVFFVIGDQIGNSNDEKLEYKILQNFPNTSVDDTGVIIKAGYESNVTEPRLSSNPYLHYEAIGIRNSFGLTIDPITGNLWDTENGPENFDEINLVPPKFNSGWAIITGPANDDALSKIPLIDNFEYSDPEFSWEKTVAPTGLAFLNSEKFAKYKNELIVGSCVNGDLFKFKLNDNRTKFEFKSHDLQDNVANLIDLENNQKVSESLDEIIFGTGFGCITDVKVGPDGFLYVVSITDNTIYRISPV